MAFSSTTVNEFSKLRPCFEIKDSTILPGSSGVKEIKRKKITPLAGL